MPFLTDMPFLTELPSRMPLIVVTGDRLVEHHDHAESNRESGFRIGLVRPVISPRARL